MSPHVHFKNILCNFHLAGTSFPLYLSPFSTFCPHCLSTLLGLALVHCSTASIVCAMVRRFPRHISQTTKFECHISLHQNECTRSIGPRLKALQNFSSGSECQLASWMKTTTTEQISFYAILVVNFFCLLIHKLKWTFIGHNFYDLFASYVVTSNSF